MHGGTVRTHYESSPSPSYCLLSYSVTRVENVSKLKYPEWQTPYQEALLESDKKKLEAKIHLTEWRIFRRLQTISADSNHQDEKVAIADALNKLRSLKSNSMNYPDSNPR